MTIYFLCTIKFSCVQEETTSPQDSSTLASTGAQPVEVDLTGELLQLQDHIAACNAVADRLTPLLPVLDGDVATTRLVVALSTVPWFEDLGLIPYGSTNWCGQTIKS